MLENAVGDRICGGDVKSFDFRMLAEREDETPLRHSREDADTISYNANIFNFDDCDLGHNFD
jgi:hypothetical protein